MQIRHKNENSPLALLFVVATGTKEKIARGEENRQRLVRSSDESIEKVSRMV